MMEFLGLLWFIIKASAAIVVVIFLWLCAVSLCYLIYHACQKETWEEIRMDRFRNLDKEIKKNAL